MDPRSKSSHGPSHHRVGSLTLGQGGEASAGDRVDRTGFPTVSRKKRVFSPSQVTFFELKGFDWFFFGGPCFWRQKNGWKKDELYCKVGPEPILANGVISPFEWSSNFAIGVIHLRGPLCGVSVWIRMVKSLNHYFTYLGTTLKTPKKWTPRTLLSVYLFFQHPIIYQHPPRGGVWTLRGRLVAPLTIHLAPLGGSRYISDVRYATQLHSGLNKGCGWDQTTYFGSPVGDQKKVAASAGSTNPSSLKWLAGSKNLIFFSIESTTEIWTVRLSYRIFDILFSRVIYLFHESELWKYHSHMGVLLVELLLIIRLYLT